MRKILVVLLFFGGILLAGCAGLPKQDAAGGNVPEKGPRETVPEKPEDTYARVEETLKQGDSEQALETLEKYRQDNPEDLSADLMTAALLMSQGRIDESRTILERVLKAEPENTQALFYMATLEGWLGNRDRQYAILQGIQEREPENSDVWSTLGDFFVMEPDLKTAKEMYEKALELDPSNITAMAGYGNILISQGKYREAEEQFDKFIQAYPSDPFIYSDRSRTRLALEDYKGADEDLTKAIELSPEYYWNYVDRGKLRLNHLYNSATALEDFNRAIELEPEYFYAYIFRAGILDDRDQIGRAMEDYKTLIRLKPDYYFAFRSLGILQYISGEWEEARENLIEAHKHEDDPGLLFLAGFTFFREGNPKAGKDYIKGFLDSLPRDSHFYNLGRMMVDPGYEVFFIRGVEGEKDLFVKTRMKFYLGAAYRAMGGDDLAAGYYREVRTANLLGMYERRIALKELETLGDSD